MHDVDTWMERMGRGDEEDSAGDRTAGWGRADHCSGMAGEKHSLPTSPLNTRSRPMVQGMEVLRTASAEA